MTKKNAVYKVDNGQGGFDEIMFKTISEQVFFDDETSLKDKFYDKKLIWKGSNYMVGPDVVNLSKKISECMNGIILVWSDYDPGAGNEGNDFNWVPTFIPKTGKFLNNSGDVLLVVPRIENDAPATERIVIKALYVKDNKLIGKKENNYNLGNDVVLREVWEV